jgi:hypothetical protein
MMLMQQQQQQMQLQLQQQQGFRGMRPRVPMAQIAPGALGVPGYGMNPAGSILIGISPCTGFEIFYTLPLKMFYRTRLPALLFMCGFSCPPFGYYVHSDAHLLQFISLFFFFLTKHLMICL